MRAMTVETLRDEAKDLHDETVRLRRQLHERPEIGNELPVTREIVLEAIDGLPLDVTLHETTSGIAALLTGGKPGPTVLLRGDMDALPLHEDTGLDFSSRSDGTMHACGHDTHVAMLAGAARLLSARRDEIPGRVLFMFQPGEEGHHGARFMLDEGLLDVRAARRRHAVAGDRSVRAAHHVDAADRMGELAAAGRSWRRPIASSSTWSAAAGTPASRSAPSTRSRSRARSCRRSR